jgi:divalent metal cation (Fe/Co/Zn/Cd) transporter
VNVLLVAAKAVAVLYSSSISLTASLVDSALDLLSTFIILGTSWAIGLKTDQHLVSFLVFLR